MATADTEPGVELAAPPLPDAGYRVVNPLVSLVLRSPLHGLVSGAIMLLSWTGRRTGTEYTTPVGYWERDGTLVAFTQSPWWRNFGEGAPVEVLLRGAWREGEAQAHRDPETVAGYVRGFVESEGIDSARRIGVRVEGDELPGDEELAAGIDGLVAIEITLDDRR